jgi:hypothetical protein
MKHRILLAFLAFAAAVAPHPARGAAAGVPTFSDPLAVTNPLHPLPPLGSAMVKSLAGDDGTSEVVILSPRTRTFEAFGQTIAAREVFELEFLFDWLIEGSANYFAQADDGTVYYFGEVVRVFEPALAGAEPSWLVGGPTLPSDPPETVAAREPAVFMPPRPAVGMTWNPEDLPPDIVETAVVLATDATFDAGAESLTGCLMLHLSSDGEDQHVKLYAPGLGEIYTADREVEFVIVSYRAAD